MKLPLPAFLAVVLLVPSARSSDFPQIILQLPGNIQSANVWVQEMMGGPFGGAGGVSRPKLGEHTITLDAGYEGEYARSIEIVIWMPGCQFVTFKTELAPSGIVRQDVPCIPAGTVRLRGSMEAKKLPAGTVLEFRYMADWMCTFFGLADCMVPQHTVASLPVGPDGTIDVELPDFANDPAVQHNLRPSVLDRFWLQLVDPKTLNHRGMLKIRNGDKLDDLKVESSYPLPIAFVTVE